jgi:hypothetical protein
VIKTRSIFFSPLLSSLLAIIALLSPRTANAQSDARVSQAMIPFAFYAGNEKMPAGAYRFEDNWNHLLILHGPNNKSVYVSVYDAPSRKSDEEGTVAFRRYGEIYFLGEIRYKETPFGVKCPTSREEANMQASRQTRSSLVTLGLDSVLR